MNKPGDNPKQREEILQSLFSIPYFQHVAKRIYKQTMNMLGQGETERKAQPPLQKNMTATKRRVIQTADGLANQLSPDSLDFSNILKEGGEKQALPEEVSSVVSTLSTKIANVSSEEFDDFIGQLQSSVNLVSNLQGAAIQESISQESLPFSPDTMSQDMKEFAASLSISPNDLEEAIRHEGLTSLEDLYRLFVQDSNSPSGMVQMGNFDIFVKCFVQSYLDEKNEEKLLGLIGVSAKTGKQKLNTPYAKLLTEIFQPEVGGFFLRNTDNPNYNCFNVGNVIQAQLLELDETARITYLENLLALLKQRDSLIPKSRETIESSVVKKHFIDMMPDKEEILIKLEQYLADLAIFRLGFINCERLPKEITSLVSKDLYECSAYVTGFPPHIVQKSNKLIYIFQRLGNNDPLLFYVSHSR